MLGLDRDNPFGPRVILAHLPCVNGEVTPSTAYADAPGSYQGPGERMCWQCEWCRIDRHGASAPGKLFETIRHVCQLKRTWLSSRPDLAEACGHISPQAPACRLFVRAE